MRRIGGAIAAASCFVALWGASPALGALSLSSTFNSNHEGWLTSQGETPPDAATWDNGAISFMDTDANPDANTLGYFIVPLSGDATDNFGGTMSFDIKSSVAWESGAFVQLTNSSFDSVCAQGSEAVGTTFQTESFELSPEGLTDCSGGAVTNVDVISVLGDLQGVVIVADEFPDAAPGNVTHLDNFSWSGGGPPAPYDVEREISIDHATISSPYLGPHEAFVGEITAADLDCANGRKVVIFRKANGPDQKLGTRFTNAEGQYKFSFKSKRGKYYASAPAEDVGLPNCLETKSSTFKIS